MFYLSNIILFYINYRNPDINPGLTDLIMKIVLFSLLLLPGKNGVEVALTVAAGLYHICMLIQGTKFRRCRIIPFVAADALVKGEDESPSETGYLPASVMVSPELRPTDASGFYDVATQENRFSPPVETEGILYDFL